MTDRFAVTARELAAVQGVPEYPFVVVEHPIAGDSDEELRTKAERAVATVVALLTQRRVASTILGSRTASRDIDRPRTSA